MFTMLRCFSVLCFLLLLIQPAFTQKKNETWSKVKILLSPSQSMKKLAGLGVETDHGQLKPGHWFVSDFSTAELKRIRRAGFQTEVLVADVQEEFLKNNRRSGSDKSVNVEYYDPACNGTGRYSIPRHWSYGSMGGHLTYKEMLNHLDSMRVRYPGLISVRQPLDTGRTENDSAVWYVRITDNPESTEPEEPKGLFTAVHHAREPLGMHQLIFFMWYLLENHAGNDEIKNLVNSSDLYFVPCVNPDGYMYNHQQFPTGGGMWRKNRRDNKNGTFGVDLNRNYGFRWGVDDFGSSPFTDNDTYRGPESFSEPETKGIRAFCEQHQFKLALNYHTYANILLYPWGYDGSAFCNDSTRFRQLAAELTKENNFRIGNCMEALNYNSNGSSDDYMYAEHPAKPPILAMTPEVGNKFWPVQEEILPNCLKTVHQNLAAVRALHPMITIQDKTGVFHHPGFTTSLGPPRLVFSVARTGTNTGLAAVFNVTFKPFGFGTEGLSPVSRTYTGLAPDQVLMDSIMIPQDDLAMINPDLVSWEVKINNQFFESTDTLFHYGGFPYSDGNLHEPCDNPGNWNGNWVFSSENPLEGSSCMKTTDGNYSSDQQLYSMRVRPFDLRSSNIHSAEMSLWTKFRVEKNYDMATLQFSTDSGATWIPVCTDKTKPSSPFSYQAGFDTITPVWDGNQEEWRREFIDLKDYLGSKLWMRFYFRSDQFTEDWGFAVDDIRVRVASIVTSVKETRGSESLSLQVLPNPGNEDSEFRLSGLPAGKRAVMKITDASGRLLKETPLTEGSNRISGSGLKPGYYLIEVISEDGHRARTSWLLK